MSTEIRQWCSDIWTYCEDNRVTVLACAAVALLVLLSVVLVCSAKREDRKAQEMPDFAEETAGAEPQMEPEPAEGPVLQESAMNMVDSLVKSMESAAGASGQKVESIELKIEKAQLTIRYAGEELFTEKAAEEAEPDAEADAAAVDSASDMQPTDFAENAGRPKRFGSDNMNTARSGRVYTEEELLNQIRD